MDPDTPCRHEFVKIYQRRLKGLERRLVATKAYLPVGFKMTDFSHLGEGSYCFCSRCRTRLFPKRTAAEKAQARLVLAQSKLQQAEADLPEEISEELPGAKTEDISIHVEELELESIELQDLNESVISIPADEGTCQLATDDEA